MQHNHVHDNKHLHTKGKSRRQREEMYIRYYTQSPYYKCTWFIKPFSAEFHTKLKPNQKKLTTEIPPFSFIATAFKLYFIVYAISKVQLTMSGTHQLLGYTENVNLRIKT